MSVRLKKRIQELEEKNNIIANNLTDAIWILDAETLKYEYITPSIEKISGYSQEEYRNLTIQDRLTPESFEIAIKVLAKEKQRFEQGVTAIEALELELIHKNGNTFWAEIRAKFVKEDGRSLKIIGVTKEITARKKAEQQKNELIKRLEEVIAEKELLLKEVKTLSRLLPICSGCKRIRDDDGKWWPMEAYVREHTDSDFTHTICSDCADVFYPELEK